MDDWALTLQPIRRGLPNRMRVLAALMHSKDEVDTDVIDAVTSPMAAPDGGVPKKNERTSVNDA